MTIYVAMLRGVNVGGKNLVKMADLQRSFLELHLGRARTYIQSGNVLFESDEREEHLRKMIEQRIEGAFRFSATVVLRTAEELGQIISNRPFSDEDISLTDSASDVEHLYVALLTQPPEQERLERLDVLNGETEEYRLRGRDVYLLLRKGFRNSRLVDNLPRLGVPFTVRNWKTLSKLEELARSMTTVGT